ncbi:CDP-alcohol phosphatidyltransferase family protein [Gammaproteobacteria bacterium]|nr:CDP-alcohol phosphatidyltransferase family protein [Gammaproteobacteria bacterium]
MKKFIQLLTISRMIAGPIIFVLIIFFQYFTLALAVFVLASFSDFMDGYLARKFNKVSTLGAILDPIADKILLTFVIISLSIELSSVFVAFIGSLILAREYWVGALREFNARSGNIKATTVTFLAKVKTAIQLISLSIYLISLSSGQTLLILIADIFLFLALIITLQTALSYTIASFKRS